MPDILYCNGFEVGHTKELFCLIFKFQTPDGAEIRTYVVVSPQGCKTILTLTAEEMADYEKEHGKVEPWKTQSPTAPNNSKNPLVS